MCELSWRDVSKVSATEVAAAVGASFEGAPGNVSIMDLVEGPVSLVDTQNNTRPGDRFLRPVDTVRAVPSGAHTPRPSATLRS